MTAFDTDVLSDVIAGRSAAMQRLAAVDPAERCVPIVAATEILRGWLNAIRQAEAGKGRIGIDLAYRQFERSLKGVAPFPFLPYTPAADALFRQWRTSIRIGTQDLRIAAICIAHNASS